MLFARKKNQQTGSTHIAIAILCLVFTCMLLGLGSYWLVSDLVENEVAIQQLRYQLIIATLLIATIGSIALFAGNKYWAHYTVIRKKRLQQPTGPIVVDPNDITPSDATTQRITQKITEPKNYIRVMSIDNDAANLAMTRLFVKDKPIHWVHASTNAEAIKYFKKEKYDIIFIDLKTEKNCDFSTLHSLRVIDNAPVRVPLIAISEHINLETKLAILTADFDDYILTPMTVEQLSLCITRWTNVRYAVPSQKPITPTPKNNTNAISASATKNGGENTSSRHKIVDIALSLKHSNQNDILARDMLQLLIQMIRDEKNTIIKQHHDENWEGLYQLNHKIYGGSAYCGVPRLYSINQRLEMLLQHNVNFGEEHTAADEINEKEEEKHNQQITESIHELLHAIDELIEWDEQYDINIVFGIDA